MNNVIIRANNVYNAPEGKSTQTYSTKSCNAATPLINTIYTVAESMTTQEPSPSRSVLIERVLIFCASSLKVTEHVVVRLNIYWGVSLHCHYHLDQFIKQQDTPMMRQLRLLNKTGWKEIKIRLLYPHMHSLSADVQYVHKRDHAHALHTFEVTELVPKVIVKQWFWLCL